MTRQEIDLQLLQEAKKGNQNAYYKLFKHYHKIINYYIWNMTKNKEDANDLTMITFEKAFLNLNNYAPTALFATWLSRIAKNTTLDFIGCKHKDKYSFFDIDGFSIVVNDYHQFYTNNNPEDELMYNELLEQLEIALNNLPSCLKEAITLWYEEELLCREIAEKQNVSINTLVGRIRYARKYLNQALTEKQVI
jgi:RNA polymerase sigma-70 factor (ECF subfamily)